MSAPQDYRNHVRWPRLHLLIVGLLLLNLIFAMYATVHSWPCFRHTHLWWVAMSMVLILLAANTRRSALRLQDRVIRLEESLRMAALLTPEQLLKTERLSVAQTVALRFAADAELPALAQRAAVENLTSKQIKESIVSWRADELRV